MDLRLKHPFSCLVVGPSNCGKTVFTKNLIKNLQTLCDPAPDIIYWAYGEYQPAYEEMNIWPNVELIEGVPDFNILKENKDKKKLLILDDLMTDLKNNGNITQLYTKGCHHWNTSCLHIVQNLFFTGLRTSRVNTHYIVLFKNPSDKLQVQTLGRQLFPKQTQYFSEAYQDATKEPYSYLFLDLHQTRQDNHRLRTNIFPGETQILYLPR
jgi:hypothetical protein